MAIKELQTRIALKYDSYSAWTTAPGKDLVLLAGELGICEIPAVNGDSRVAPTVLFKVGDGTKTFEQLPWASAKAADVYSWAKATDVTFTGKTIKFVKGNADGTDKTITLDYLTETEIKAITNPIASRVSALEGKFGENGDVTTQLAGLDSRLDVIEGSGEGSVAKALTDAKAYTDAREVEINKYADQAEADAKSYTDTEVAKDRTRLGALEAADSAQDTLIANNKQAIEDEAAARATAVSGEATARANADDAINAKFGTGISANNTVAQAIEAAKTAAATDAQNKVKALADGQVATNKADIASLNTALGTETSERKAADKALEDRLVEVEAFFKTTEGETIDKALDTLVEIQEYLNGEGEATGGLIGRVTQNEADIDALQATLAKDGAFEKRVAAVEGRATAVEGRATTLENIVKGYTGENAIKNAVDAVSTRAEKGITDAATAQTAADNAQAAADKAQGEVDALETVVAGVKTTADTAKSDLAALTTRVGTAEGEIDALQAIVTAGNNTNAKLREDITALQNLTGDASKGNAQLRTELTALQGVVNDSATGLAKTKAIADGAASQASTNKSDIAAIKADYLKAADAYIFNCGSATTVTHTA
jgi:hypothetical protein